ncbi:MAG TPA: hypothetical protein VGI10_16390 [Polyangiaceae bacterium]|jgi:hypothetical protein
MAQQRNLSPGKKQGLTARGSLKLWWGIFFGFVAGALGIGAFVFIWFGFFPGLVLLLLCLPVALFARHLIRVGRPPRTA